MTGCHEDLLSFCSLCIYDMTIVLPQMKRSNAHEVTPSSSGDVVNVFMSSFSETADAENTARQHALEYVCVQ